MRLDKFRGWGPWLAFASPACLILGLVVAAIAVAQIPTTAKVGDPLPATFYVVAILALVLLGLWMITMLAVAIDLEWIEHPLTHTGLTYLALAACAAATLAFVLAQLLPLVHVGADWLYPAWFAGVGVYLVIINLVGRRARVLTGPLPWVGLAAGIVQLLSALIALTPFAALTALLTIVFGLLYIVWSVWLGFTLRGRTPAVAPAAPTGAPA